MLVPSLLPSNFSPLLLYFYPSSFSFYSHLFIPLEKTVYLHITWLLYLSYLSLLVLWLLWVQVKIKSQVEDGTFHSISETLLSSHCEVMEVFLFFRSTFKRFASDPASFTAAVSAHQYVSVLNKTMLNSCASSWCTVYITVRPNTHIHTNCFNNIHNKHMEQEHLL